MGNFHYPRHFTALGVAAVLLFLLNNWEPLSDSLLASFALDGILHASTLVLALRSPQSRPRRLTFILLAGVLSVFTLYVGILGLVLFAVLPGGERLYADLGLCSLTGAIIYGSLIRIFWVRKLRPRQILAAGFGCALASLLALLLKTHFGFLGGWWLASAWWFAFSGALWLCDTRSADRGRGTMKVQGGASP